MSIFGSTFLATLLLLVGLPTGGLYPAIASELLYQPPMERFVTNRPRLFLSAESLPVVMQYVATAHHDFFNAMRDYLNLLMTSTNLLPGDYGMESAAAAFLFLCERTPQWFNAATTLLVCSVDYYRDCDRSNRPVNWYAFSRIHAIAAYDWLYDAMDPELRARLGREIMDHVEHAQPGNAPPPGANLGDYRHGFYGERSLVWYAGIALRGTGIDEAKAELAIAFGYDQNMRLLNHRRRIAGDDGAVASPTLDYALRANPWAEFNFFHTMTSAFGLDIATNWPHVALLSNYVLWNVLPGGQEFGAGDTDHQTNLMKTEQIYTHCAQIRHFFGTTEPQWASAAGWIQDNYCQSHDYFVAASPITPFLLTAVDQAPPAIAPPTNLPLARHFAGVGQIFMRSGWGDNDTCALFTAGGSVDGSQGHKHFDENNFTIFHKGFLALDTGTRPYPGNHLFQYYGRSVAHNCILIRMEGEILPLFWGEPAPDEPVLPIANDGGMRLTTGAVIRAFRTTSDYTYIASDATACYHPDKCRLALRQFVHIQPDIFVIFDRVQTVQPDQQTTWLLHTVEEPRIETDRFSADHRDGRLWCRTFLPRDARLSKVGGPGKEFWSDGRNWPLPTNSWPRQTELTGRWRLEVSPSEPATNVYFLHVIEVGDRLTKTNMCSSWLQEDAERAGVEFRFGEREVSVSFRKNGDAACEIRIQGEGKSIGETLDNTTLPQSGWASTTPQKPKAPSSLLVIP